MTISPQVAGPFGFAPTAAHKLAHPDGELATSRAAAVNNLPMCLSSWSNTNLEDVIAAGGSNPYAMQVTFLRDIRITQQAIKQAESEFFPI
jgi:(S)-2-hydroxy-acid oxidase